MDKTALITVIIIVVLGAGAFVLFSQGGLAPSGDNQPSGDQPSGQGTSTQPNQEVSLEDPLKSAIEADGEVQCSFDDAQGVSGTAQVDSGQIRVTAETPQGNAHVIFGNERTWVWQDGAPNGIVFTPDEVNPQLATQVPNKDAFVQQLAQSQDTCSAQEVQDSQFEAPQDLSFQDLDEVQPQQGGQPTQ